MTDRTPARLEQLLEALLQEHGLITSDQAGRLLAGAAAQAGEAAITARGRAWCIDLQHAGRLQPARDPDTWIQARR